MELLPPFSQNIRRVQGAHLLPGLNRTPSLVSEKSHAVTHKLGLEGAGHTHWIVSEGPEHARMPTRGEWLLNLVWCLHSESGVLHTTAFRFVPSVQSPAFRRTGPAKAGTAPAKALPASCWQCFPPIGLPAGCRQHSEGHGH